MISFTKGERVRAQKISGLDGHSCFAVDGFWVEGKLWTNVADNAPVLISSITASSDGIDPEVLVSAGKMKSCINLDWGVLFAGGENGSEAWLLKHIT